MKQNMINKLRAGIGINAIKKDLTEQREKLDDLLQTVHFVKNSQTIVISEREAITRLFTGQLMSICPTDISLAPHIMLNGGVWEPANTDLVHKLVRDNNVVMDVGANFGYFGIVANSFAKLQKTIFVEANPRLPEYIHKSLSFNGLRKKTSVENVAISDEEGEIELHVFRRWTGSSSVVEKNINPNGVISVFNNEIEVVKVKAETIDSIISRNNIEKVDFIKIDIEGAEQMAFTGMKNVIKKSDNLKILMEFTARSYDNPERFFASQQKNFPFIYKVEDSEGLAKLTLLKEYEDLKSITEEHSDILLSKKEITL